MQTRREFLKVSGAFTAGSLLLSKMADAAGSAKVQNPGLQLYTLRKEMAADAAGTLKQLAAIGYKQLESARSDKGNYYGLDAKEIRKICSDHGMTLRSGHVHVDENWQKSIDQAAEAGQEYLICSSMSTRGQTVSNYQKVADEFNKAGEQCKKANLKFGYHNHDYEFEKENGKVLYDVLVEKTDPKLVHLELDLGWVIAAGADPMYYFNKFPGRFPLWHLKDMDLAKKHSVEFGKGGLNILKMLQSGKKAGMRYFFVEQEEYSVTPIESCRMNYDYLSKLNV